MCDKEAFGLGSSNPNRSRKALGILRRGITLKGIKILALSLAAACVGAALSLLILQGVQPPFVGRWVVQREGSTDRLYLGKRQIVATFRSVLN